MSLLRLVATLPPAPADTRGTELERVCWTYLEHRVAEALAPFAIVCVGLFPPGCRPGASRRVASSASASRNAGATGRIRRRSEFEGFCLVTRGNVRNPGVAFGRALLAALRAAPGTRSGFRHAVTIPDAGRACSASIGRPAGPVSGSGCRPYLPVRPSERKRAVPAPMTGFKDRESGSRSPVMEHLNHG